MILSTHSTKKKFEILTWMELIDWLDDPKQLVFTHWLDVRDGLYSKFYMLYAQDLLSDWSEMKSDQIRIMIFF